MKPCTEEEETRGALLRTELFFKRLLTGGELLDQSEPCYEEVEGRYDVGEIVREYSVRWLKTPPVNLVTPLNLLELLQFLDRFTTALEAEDMAQRSVGSGLVPCEATDAGYKQVCIDLARWRARLDAYLDEAEVVTVAEENDRRLTLWSITAPLFLGWYGGETGTEIALAPGGFPEGFNTIAQHTADIATPYIIANQLEVFFNWEEERRRRLVQELTAPLKSAGTNLLLIAAVAGLGYVGWNMLKRK